MLPNAYAVLQNSKIVKNGKIDKAYRGQISSFGASVMSGSVLAAIAFFGQKAGSDVHREYIIADIFSLLKKEGVCKNERDLFDYATQNPKEAKDKILAASVALKLAMNLFVLEEKDAANTAK